MKSFDTIDTFIGAAFGIIYSSDVAFQKDNFNCYLQPFSCEKSCENPNQFVIQFFVSEITILVTQIHAFKVLIWVGFSQKISIFVLDYQLEPVKRVKVS